jgi:hypothetical protein
MPPWVWLILMLLLNLSLLGSMEHLGRNMSEANTAYGIKLAWQDLQFGLHVHAEPAVR